MDPPTRFQLESGHSRLSAAQKENFDCYFDKLREEEKKSLRQDDLFEEVKDPDILLNTNSAEPTVETVGDLQKEMKIEKDPDVYGPFALSLNAADLLDESDTEMEVKVEENFDVTEESAITGFTSTWTAAELLDFSDEVKMNPNEQFPNEEILNPKYYSKKTDKRHLFNCPVELCPLSCMKFEQLDEHVKMSHSDEEFLSCDVCMKSFSSLDDAMAHIWQRETKKCCGCGKSFDLKSCLRSHIVVHMKPFFCGECKIRFAKEEQLEEHERTHLAMEQPFDQGNVKEVEDGGVDEMGHEDEEDIGEVPEPDSDDEAHGVHKKKKSNRPPVGRRLFTCLLKNCSVSYTKFDELAEHMKCHFGKQEPSCDACKKSFSSKEDALEHIREREKKECCACGKKFSSAYTMVPHLRKHTGEEPFICKTCGKGFGMATSFKYHKLSHTGEKNFECGFCEENFARKDDLNRHKTEVHGEKPFKCDYCDYKCSARYTLIAHKRKHTGEKPYSCGHCGKRFSHKGNHKKHELMHSEDKPFECKDCGKRFCDGIVLARHIRIHASQKSFSCEKCDAKFSVEEYLKKHVKRMHPS